MRDLCGRGHMQWRGVWWRVAGGGSDGLFDLELSRARACRTLLDVEPPPPPLASERALEMLVCATNSTMIYGGVDVDLVRMKRYARERCGYWFLDHIMAWERCVFA